MANPFPAKFDSKCQQCGSPMFKGNDTFVVDGMFICPECAKENNAICKCGNAKKPDYRECFQCFKDSANEEIANDFGME